MSKLEAIKANIWLLFDNIRNEVTPEDYYIILLFLSAYKDGVFSSEILTAKTNVKESIINDFERIDDDQLSEQYLLYWSKLEPAIDKLRNKTLSAILNLLFELDKVALIEHFPEVFDNILYQIAKSQGSLGGELLQPVEITRLMCNLAEIPKNAKVFNPFAGFASFEVFLKPQHWYFGQEFNPRTWTIGALRIMAYGRTNKVEYIRDDSILNWPGDHQKYDLIISNPPFGMPLKHQYKITEPGIKRSEQFILAKVLESLTETGKFIGLFPQNILTSGGRIKQIRELLIQKDLIDTIISLPGGILQNTNMPIIILVINKSKKQPGMVRFVRADKFVEARNPREKLLNDYALNRLIHGSKVDEDALRIVDNEQIRAWDYNLNVPRYFRKEISLSNNEQLVKLKHILEYVRGQRGNLPKNGKLIRIRDLRDDNVDFRLMASEVENAELRRPDIHQINETCLLLAIRWRTLKPTHFVFEGSSIYRSHDILSFKVNESVADYGYLINELHADYVQEQMESYRMGATIPLIRRDDLLEVAIKLPPLQEQKAKVKGIFELSKKIKSLQEERNALAHGKTVKQLNEFASLKHTLGRPRQNILDWSDNLLDFLNKKRDNFELLNKEFAEFYDIDIISALKEIKRDVNFITDVLEKGENGLVLSEYEKKFISLSDINSIINELSNNRFIFKIKKLLMKGEKLKERGIYANKTLFKTLLYNILTNANKYAFEKNAAGNEVVVELAEVDDFLSMEIRNNGKPFPKNFDREKFITKYSTADSSSGSGLGGYDIHRIATSFDNPDWILSLNEDPFFLVKFKFQFPIKLIN